VAEFTSIARAYVNETSAARDNRTKDAAIGNGPIENMRPLHISEIVQQAPQPSALLALGHGSDQDQMNLVSHACHSDPRRNSKSGTKHRAPFASGGTCR
jgi:hypothetical protein